MKKWKRLLVSLLTVSMTLGASTMSVMADDTTQYTYKHYPQVTKEQLTDRTRSSRQTLLPILPLLSI